MKIPFPSGISKTLKAFKENKDTQRQLRHSPLIFEKYHVRLDEKDDLQLNEIANPARTEADPAKKIYLTPN